MSTIAIFIKLAIEIVIVPLSPSTSGGSMTVSLTVAIPIFLITNLLIKVLKLLELVVQAKF